MPGSYIKRIKRTFWKTEDGREFDNVDDANIHRVEIDLAVFMLDKFYYREIDQDQLAKELVANRVKIIEILKKADEKEES